MVVGNGLIASIFSAFADHEDVVIFASGVSNSKEDNEEAFQREIDLLNKFAKRQSLLVYFSTFSVFDPSLQNTPYVKHKLRMEQLVRASTNSHIIFRLPIMIGVSDNPNTLINYLIDCVKNGTKFSLYTNACRYLTSASDLKQLLPDIILNSEFANRTFNVGTSENISVHRIVSSIEKLIGKKALYTEVSKGNCYDVEISEAIKSQPAFKLREPEEFLREIINE